MVVVNGVKTFLPCPANGWILKLYNDGNERIQHGTSRTVCWDHETVCACLIDGTGGPVHAPRWTLAQIKKLTKRALIAQLRKKRCGQVNVTGFTVAAMRVRLDEQLEKLWNTSAVEAAKLKLSKAEAFEARNWEAFNIQELTHLLRSENQYCDLCYKEHYVNAAKIWWDHKLQAATVDLSVSVATQSNKSNKSKKRKSSSSAVDGQSKAKKKNKRFSIVDLLREGVIQAGSGVLKISHKDVDYSADLTASGKIRFSSVDKRGRFYRIFNSPSGLTKFIKKTTDNGWTSLYYKGIKLDDLRRKSSSSSSSSSSSDVAFAGSISREQQLADGAANAIDLTKQ